MRILSKIIGLGAVLSLAMTSSTAMGDTNNAKRGQLSGNVRTFNKERGEITLRRGTADRIVIVGSGTKFKMQSATSAKPRPSSIDEVNDSTYMICTGTWDGTRLAATTCTISPAKQR